MVNDKAALAQMTRDERRQALVVFDKEEIEGGHGRLSQMRCPPQRLCLPHAQRAAVNSLTLSRHFFEQRPKMTGHNSSSAPPGAQEELAHASYHYCLNVRADACDRWLRFRFTGDRRRTWRGRARGQPSRRCSANV